MVDPSAKRDARERRLSAIDKVRIFVVDADGAPRSDLWVIHSHGDHVYAAPRNLGGALKLSLHPAEGARDGCDCQFGHPRTHAEHQAALGFKPMRPLRWTRRATPETGAVHIASIVFPTDFLGRAPAPPDDRKTKFALPLAPPAHATEAGLFISRQAPADLEEVFITGGGTPIIYMDLPSGEFVSIVVRHRPFYDLGPELAKMKTMTPIPLSGAPRLGESLEGRAIIVGEPPRDGGAFQLMEIGPLRVSRGLAEVTQG